MSAETNDIPNWVSLIVEILIAVFAIVISISFYIREKAGHKESQNKIKEQNIVMAQQTQVMNEMKELVNEQRKIITRQEMLRSDRLSVSTNILKEYMIKFVSQFDFFCKNVNSEEHLIRLVDTVPSDWEFLNELFMISGGRDVNGVAIGYVGKDWFRTFDEHCKLIENELPPKKREILRSFRYTAHFWFELDENNVPLFVEHGNDVSLKSIKESLQRFSKYLKEFET